jgi:hypothetical protein
VDIDFLTRHWGLVVAVALLCIVGVIVIVALMRRSRSGLLRSRFRGVRAARDELARAERTLASRKHRLERLEARADRVRPREIDEVRGQLDDAASLVRIRSDQLMVAENQLRKLIFKEFPPARHEALRRRYLPEDVEDGRPFTF